MHEFSKRGCKIYGGKAEKPLKIGGKPEKAKIICRKPEKGSLTETGKSHFQVTESRKTLK